MPQHTQSLTIRELRALLQCASEDVARANICGLTVRGDGALAASDGHSLVVRGHEPRESWRGAKVVPRAEVVALSQGARAKDVVTYDPATGELRLVGADKVARANDTPPCPFDVLLGGKRGKPAPLYGFAPHLLARLDVIDRAILGRAPTMYGWVFSPGGAEDALHAWPVSAGAAGVPWLVVIMPMRI